MLETEPLWKGRAEPEAVEFGAGKMGGREGDSLELWWWEGELNLKALIFGVRLWLRI